jgi:outer membrane protein OmpA-like peptidoglycan-associated protein
MHKAFFLAFPLAPILFAQGAFAAQPGSNFNEPVSSRFAVSFADSSTSFRPDPDTMAALADAKDAAAVYINGRTSTNQPSARDEALALQRALSARSYLIARGVSPLKIMVNFASAADYATENMTPQGRYQNQRVDIELVYVPAF